MPANGRWDLIRHLKVKEETADYKVGPPRVDHRFSEFSFFTKNCLKSVR